VPLVLAVLGIVLRGSGFAFRASVEGLQERRAAGATFALSSVITPFFMGTVVGALAVGNVPAAGAGDAFSSWLAPAPLFIGAMFVATSAYLAAVFLVGDSRRAGDREMELYFEKRALAAGVVAGLFAIVGLIALHSEGHYVYNRLVHEGLPLVIISAVCGIGMLAVLLFGGRLLLRPLAAGAVIAVVWGWFVAQFPYLLPTTTKISEAAAPDATLGAIFIVFGIACVVVLPALVVLYILAQGDMLEHEH
jgi:cytochrome bd ubiquinol oxidase subunit II